MPQPKLIGFGATAEALARLREKGIDSPNSEQLLAMLREIEKERPGALREESVATRRPVASARSGGTYVGSAFHQAVQPTPKYAAQGKTVGFGATQEAFSMLRREGITAPSFTQLAAALRKVENDRPGALRERRG